MEIGGESLWNKLLGHDVVLDLASSYVVIGRLVGASGELVEFEDVDIHDLRDTQTTREKYILDCRLHGVRANRARAWVNLREVVGISRLSDVVVG